MQVRLPSDILKFTDRMPSQIGNFISDAVYDGQLRSNPSHPLANDLCAFFVHVPDSTELPHGTSYYVSISVTFIWHYLRLFLLESY